MNFIFLFFICVTTTENTCYHQLSSQHEIFRIKTIFIFWYGHFACQGDGLVTPWHLTAAADARNYPVLLTYSTDVILWWEIWRQDNTDVNVAVLILGKIFYPIILYRIPALAMITSWQFEVCLLVILVSSIESLNFIGFIISFAAAIRPLNTTQECWNFIIDALEIRYCHTTLITYNI